MPLCSRAALTLVIGGDGALDGRSCRMSELRESHVNALVHLMRSLPFDSDLGQHLMSARYKAWPMFCRFDLSVS